MSGDRWVFLVLVCLALAAAFALWGRRGSSRPGPDEASEGGEDASETLDSLVEDEPDMPALEVLQDFVKAAAGDQLERSKSFDQRGGVLLGFAGVLVGLVLRDLSSLGSWGAFGGGLAAVAAILSALVILPNTAGGLNPKTMLEEYAAAPQETARFRVLSTLADVFEVEETRINRKARLLRVATLVLPLAGAILIVGAIVKIEPAEEPSAVQVETNREVQDDEQAGQIGDPK